MSQSKQSNMQEDKYRIETDCGREQTYSSNDAAKDGKDTHARFCQECSRSDLEIEKIGGEKPDAEVVEHTDDDNDTSDESDAQDADDAESAQTEQDTQDAERPVPPEPDQRIDDGSDTDAELVEDIPDKPPERNLSDDPVEWFGDVGEFTYEKKGTTCINKKGLRVLEYWYDIDITDSEVLVGPEETDQQFARVRAEASMPDGRSAVAHGSAHVDRGDDPWLLTEMADTRAKSRVLLDITGMGAVAVAELDNEL